MPALSEQYDIAAVLQSCDTKIAALDREIDLLDELFQALLEELMSGRLSARALIDDS
jgi:type I restriction enzyme S subunit